MEKAFGNRSIRILENGPILVKGSLPLAEETMILGADGEPAGWARGEDIKTSETFSLCRCGKTGHAPFCDGTHIKEEFNGTETAPLAIKPEVAEVTKGPALSLADVPCLCAIARFCHRQGDAWTLTEESGDPEKKRVAVESAANCPSGRITAINNETGRTLEPDLAPSIGLIRDTYHHGLGPIWVKGGVPIESASGEGYEARNRVTLCRCGLSENKPLCDGTHLKCRFGKEPDKP
ncbi:MAG: CDGSH iron-sulfur domain-containing protein [Candidatus Aminicenantes bacterium]|nr:CDGSH iron-sulfur domain-containing protein [Candidatus Aminicenantes bacterium]